MLSQSGIRVHIVGSGLAGSEAAYLLAEQGIEVILHEMRPGRMTEAHKTDRCAELVCSNSLKSKVPTSAPGMLKAEMTRVGSLILKAAAHAAVPGGDALAVDRDVFADFITRAIDAHPRIKRVPGEVIQPFEDDASALTLFATGPLTSPSLTEWIEKATADATEGAKSLYFYDAIAPVVDASTIDMEHAFLQNRYDKGLEPSVDGVEGEAAYLNCPMSEEQYYAFIDALASGEKVPPKNFEKEIFFQGCQPIEAIAATGRESLRFGPMKPVGLTDPRTGAKAYAVVQLRPENRAKTAYNIVGFQTKLKYGEQARILRMIPALARAEFVRMGSIHRNTYVCGPKVLRPDLSLKGHPRVYFAGQITGVEGYLESAACGMLAAMFIAQRAKGLRHDAPPANTALGALLRHITGSEAKNYQPANISFSLFDPALFDGVANLKKDELRTALANQTLKNFEAWHGAGARQEASNAN